MRLRGNLAFCGLVTLVLAPSLCAEGFPAAIVPVPLRAADGSLLPAGILVSEAPTTREARVPSVPLEPVAQIDPMLFNEICFGDTDHDGRIEAFLYVKHQDSFHYRILEEQGANTYSMEYEGPALLPYATGDLDGDGLMEIVGQLGPSIYVYESLSPGAYPTRLAWVSPEISTMVGFLKIGDTDRDGRKEMILSKNPMWGDSEILIFENTGNDAYALVYQALVGPGANGEKVIADFDGDGQVEIAMSGLEGTVYVFESTANNLWVQTWSGPTSLVNAYGAEGGVDTDGNGRPELFIMGNGPNGWTTVVFGASEDDFLSSVQEFAINDGFIGQSFNALGQLDGNGAPEYLMEGGQHLWIYQCGAQGQWTLRETLDDPLGGQHNGLQTCDVNRNGRDEVFWDVETFIEWGWKTLVLEDASNPVAVNGPQTTAPVKLVVAPNPIRKQTTIRFASPLVAPRWLTICDVAGRVVSRVPFDGDELSLDARDVVPGTYFLQLWSEGGEELARGRAIVLH